MGCFPSKSVLLEDDSCFYYDWAKAQGSNIYIEVHIPEFVLQRNNGQSEINDAVIDEDLNETKIDDVKTKIKTSSKKTSDNTEDAIETAKEATIAELKDLFEKRKNEIPVNNEVAEVKTNDARTQFLNSQLFSATAQTVCVSKVQDVSKESEKDSSKANNETLRRSSRKDSFMNKILVYYFRPKTGK